MGRNLQSGPRAVNKARSKKSAPKSLWTPRGLVGQTNDDVPDKINKESQPQITLWDFIEKSIDLK